MKLRTPKQIAASTGLSASLIYALVRQGRLPAYRIGCHGRGRVMIAEEDWEGFLRTCKPSDWKTDGDGEEAYRRHAK
ncbi:MAG: helix-turn-helix domain-containing protein [Gemmataceae bacterium]